MMGKVVESKCSFILAKNSSSTLSQLEVKKAREKKKMRVPYKGVNTSLAVRSKYSGKKFFILDHSLNLTSCCCNMLGANFCWHHIYPSIFRAIKSLKNQKFNLHRYTNFTWIWYDDRYVFFWREHLY